MLLVLFAQVSYSEYVLLYSFLSVCPVFVGVCERGCVRVIFASSQPAKHEEECVRKQCDQIGLFL